MRNWHRAYLWPLLMQLSTLWQMQGHSLSYEPMASLIIGVFVVDFVYSLEFQVISYFLLVDIPGTFHRAGSILSWSNHQVSS